MAVPVIDPLEVIEIDHRHRAVAKLEEVVEAPLDRVAVPQTGQRIAPGHAFQFGRAGIGKVALTPQFKETDHDAERIGQHFCG